MPRLSLPRMRGKSAADSQGKSAPKSSQKPEETQALNSSSTPVMPTLSRRHANRKSTIKSGRVIGSSRERLETDSERLAAHRKIHRRQVSRVVVSALGLVIIGAGLFYLGTFLFGGRELSLGSTSVTIPYSPTIPVEDQDAGSDSRVTSRMREYIGMVEADLRELGLVPVRAVIPSGAIREVDIYLDGYTGFIKTTIDRGAGVTAEDAERMLRYLAEREIADFEYIDVRLDGQAYWK